MRRLNADRRGARRKYQVPLLVSLSFLVVLHFVALLFVFTVAKRWDNACDVLFDESGREPGSWLSAEGRDGSYYANPGYTCEYSFADGETLVLRRDLSGARNLVIAITGVGVIVAALIVATRDKRLPV